MMERLYIKDAKWFGQRAGSIVTTDDGRVLHELPWSLEQAAENTRRWYLEAEVIIVRDEEMTQ